MPWLNRPRRQEYKQGWPNGEVMPWFVEHEDRNSSTAPHKVMSWSGECNFLLTKPCGTQ